MDSTQRSEFKGHLSALFGAWGRTVWDASEEGYWKGLSRMSLADFARCVDKACLQFGDEPDMKLPTVGTLWAIKRQLRAAPISTPAPRDLWAGDKWAQLANQHLLGYILRPPLRQYDAAATAILVEFKNGWACDMRESAEDGTLPEDGGMVWWISNMQRAEERIAAKVAA